MPTPRRASVDSRRWTSAFVPMSMPRVGSSTMRILGSVASHFARTTFCWFPPDREEAGECWLAALTSRVRVHC